MSEARTTVRYLDAHAAEGAHREAQLRWTSLFSAPMLFALILLCSAALPVDAAEPAAPTNERCLNCHADDELTNDAGQSMAVHAEDFLGGAHEKLQCVDCHVTALEVRHPRNPLGPVPMSACEKCHADDVRTLPTSVHGTLNDEPFGPATCAACHDSAHTTKNRANQASAAHPVNQADSCGGCHRIAKRTFAKSAHAEALAAGDMSSPSCAGCHSAHAVQPVNEVRTRLTIANEACGDCHEERGISFRDNFHGQMAHLEFGGAAFCADCHRAHDVLPASNPESSVAPTNLVDTCGDCHEQANANFVKYEPHANPHDREEGVLLWSVMLFMEILIIGVFAFFGAHSILWFVRSMIDRNRS